MKHLRKKFVESTYIRFSSTIGAKSRHFKHFVFDSSAIFSSFEFNTFPVQVLTFKIDSPQIHLKHCLHTIILRYISSDYIFAIFLNISFFNRMSRKRRINCQIYSLTFSTHHRIMKLCMDDFFQIF